MKNPLDKTTDEADQEFFIERPAEKINPKTSTNAGTDRKDSSGKSGTIDYNLEEFYIGINDQKYIKITKNISLGRNNVNGISLDEENISPNHCKFYFNNNLLSVMDFGGPTGTYVNNIQISPGNLVVLQYGDTLKVGSNKLSILAEIPLILEKVQKKVKEKINIATEKTKEEKDKGKDKNLNHTSIAHKSFIELFIENSSKNFTLFILFIKTFFKNLAINFVFPILKEKYELIGFKFRILAFLLDLILSFLCYFSLKTLPQYNDFSLSLVSFLKQIFLDTNHSGPLPYHFNSVILDTPLIPYMTLQFLGVILFGVSLSQFILGIRGSGTFMANRILGILRTFFDILLGPLIIFDLPCLKDIPTLKEILSRSFLLKKMKIVEEKDQEEKAAEKSDKKENSDNTKDGKDELTEDETAELSFVQKILHRLKILKSFFNRLYLNIVNPILKEQYELAGFKVRILAFSLDLTLSFLCYFFLKTLPQYNEFSLSLINFLKQIFLNANHSGPLPYNLNSVILDTPLILYMTLQFSGVLLFGVSLSQFILGIRGSGNFITNRILGFFRTLFGIVFGPLIIFDLPNLKEIPTFKEILCRSFLLKKVKIAKVAKDEDQKEKIPKTKEEKDKLKNGEDELTEDDIEQLSFVQRTLYRLKLVFSNFKIFWKIFFQKFIHPTLKEQYELAGFKVRILAFSLDLILSFLCYFSLKILPQYNEFSLSLVNFLKQIFLDANPYNLNSVILDTPLIPYMALQFLGVLLFGVSLSQFILGIRGSDNFITNRILGIFRAIFDLLFCPFIIFDLPNLKGVPTLKELLCRSFLLKKIKISSTEVAKEKIAEKISHKENNENAMTKEELDKLSFIKRIPYRLRLYLANLKNRRNKTKDSEGKQEKKINQVENPLTQKAEEKKDIEIPDLPEISEVPEDQLSTLERLKKFFFDLKFKIKNFPYLSLFSFFQKDSRPPIGPLLRLQALISDMAIFYILHLLIIDLSPLKSDLQNLSVILHKSLLEIFPQIKDIFTEKNLLIFSYYFLSYALMEITSTIFLGLSFSKFLFGMKSSRSGTGVSGFLLNRTTAILRSVLGMILFPLLICDLPCLLKRRTLKEVLSGSYFVLRNKYHMKIGRSLIFPLIILSVFYFPLIQDVSHLGGIEVATLQKGHRLPAASKKASTVYSQSLKLNFNVSGLKNFLIIPHKDNKISLYNFVTGNFLTINKTQNFSLLQWINRNEDRNPFFAKKYPHLHEHLMNLAKKSAKPEVSNKNNELIESELQSYVASAMKLGPHSLFDYTMKFGPFIYGPVQVRKKILDYLKYEGSSALDIQKLGQQNFITYASKDGQKKQTYTLLPLTLSSSSVIQLEITNNNLNSAINKKLITNIFSDKLIGNDTIPQDEISLQNLALRIADLMDKPTITTHQQEVIKKDLNYLQQAYIQKAVEKKNPELQKFLDGAFPELSK